MTTYTNGQRVKYVGISGLAEGPVGRVIRQYKSGVYVRWDGGDKYSVHPGDIRVMPDRL